MSHRHLTVAAVATLVAAGLGAAAPASADPLPSTPNISALRQATVDRADKALNNPRGFKTENSEVVHQSTVRPGQNRNVLELSGSNANRNVFNDWNGNSWCGSFIAAMWTGQNMPNPASYPRIPTSFESSQAWATDAKVKDLYHPFTGANQALPKPGDVLVWKDDGSSWAGHVGLVVKTYASSRTVVTVEGNVDGDEIAKKTYVWGDKGPARAGKTFRGYTSRE